VNGKRKAATYPSFIVLLARQRSGTNALREILETHPDISCLPEVFSFIDKDSDDPHKREPNFFNFLEKYASGDPRRMWPDHHETLFLDFLEYLRCFRAKQYVVIDIKYMSTRFLTEPWARNITSPYLFDLITEYDLSVLNIGRKNYLRYFLSNEKAAQTGRYHTWAGDTKFKGDHPMRVDVGFLLETLEKCADEDQSIRKRFAGYPKFALYDYADIFPGRTEEVSSEFLESVAKWLDVPNVFSPVPHFKKQSVLPLAETIENFAEVQQALRGTSFEYCLEDEPAYRLRAAEA
jgi:hypothetical protein